MAAKAIKALSSHCALIESDRERQCPMRSRFIVIVERLLWKQTKMPQAQCAMERQGFFSIDSERACDRKKKKRYTGKNHENEISRTRLTKKWCEMDARCSLVEKKSFTCNYERRHTRMQIYCEIELSVIWWMKNFIGDHEGSDEMNRLIFMQFYIFVNVTKEIDSK